MKGPQFQKVIYCGNTMGRGVALTLQNYKQRFMTEKDSLPDQELNLSPHPSSWNASSLFFILSASGAKWNIDYKFEMMDLQKYLEWQTFGMAVAPPTKDTY